MYFWSFPTKPNKTHTPWCIQNGMALQNKDFSKTKIFPSIYHLNTNFVSTQRNKWFYISFDSNEFVRIHTRNYEKQSLNALFFLTKNNILFYAIPKHSSTKNTKIFKEKTISCTINKDKTEKTNTHKPWNNVFKSFQFYFSRNQKKNKSFTNRNQIRLEW